jgi:hypothetical protein
MVIVKPPLLRKAGGCLSEVFVTMKKFGLYKVDFERG